MAEDNFNENDLADLDNAEPQPSESPELTPEQDKNIEDAINRFFGKVTGEEREEAKAEDTKPAKPSPRELRRRQNSQQEQQDELVEEGVEAEDPAERGEEKDGGTEVIVPAEQKGEQDSEGADKPADEKPAEPASSKLDPTLRFFAEQELGWSQEKLDKLAAADPELANEMIAKVAETYANLSRQMLAPVAPQVAPGTQPQQQTPAQSASPTSKLDQIHANLASFAEANGEELTEYVKALKAEVIDPVREIMAELRVQQERRDGDEARDTFAVLKERFPTLYGSKPWQHMSEAEQKASTMLGETADQLRAGAKDRGQKLSVKEAINRAHMLVSAPFRAAEVRQEIKGQVQTRHNRITAKPTNHKGSVAKPKSREAAAEALEKRAAELGVVGFEE